MWLRARLNVTLDGDEHAFTLSMSLAHGTLRLATHAPLDASALGALTLGGLVACPACAVSPLGALRLTGDSPLLELAPAPRGEMRLDAAHLAGDDGAATPVHQLPPATLRRMLGVLTPGVVGLLNDGLAASLDASHATCARASNASAGTAPPPPPPPPLEPLAQPDLPSIDKEVFGTAAGVVFGLALVLMAWCFCCRDTRRPPPRDTAMLNTAAGAAAAEASGELPAGGGGGADAPPETPGKPSTHLLAAAAPSREAPCYVLPDRSLSAQPLLQRCGLRLALPLLCLANGCLFAADNTQSGGEVGATAWLAGQPMKLPPLFFLSLFGTIHDFYLAGVYIVCGVVGAASAVWPYLRLVLLLLCLYVPPSRLSPIACERMLRFCDAMGKFALVDFVMLNLLTVVFRLDASLPVNGNYTNATSGGSLGDEDEDASSDADAAPFFSVSVRVSEMTWYLCFPIAICMSLVISHVLLALQRASTTPLPYHRAPPPGPPPHHSNRVSTTSSIGNVDAEGGINAADKASGAHPHQHQHQHQHQLLQRQQSQQRLHAAPLCDEPFARLLCFRGRLPWLVRRGVAPLLLALGFLVVYSVAFLPAFTVTMEGLVATLLPPEAAAATRTLLTVGLELPRSAGHAAGSSPFMVSAAEIIFICVLLVLPLAWLALLALLWAAPLTAAQQRRVVRAAERCFAWAAPDVFVLTIIAGLAQLPKYAQFMLGDECDGLNDVLSAHFAELLPGQPVCLAIVPQLRIGCYVLLPTLLVATPLGYFVLHAAAVMLEHDPNDFDDSDGSGGSDGAGAAAQYQSPLATSLLSEDRLASEVAATSLATARLVAEEAGEPSVAPTPIRDERLARARAAAQRTAADEPASPEADPPSSSGRPSQISADFAV